MSIRMSVVCDRCHLSHIVLPADCKTHREARRIVHHWYGWKVWRNKWDGDDKRQRVGYICRECLHICPVTIPPEAKVDSMICEFCNASKVTVEVQNG